MAAEAVKPRPSPSAAPRDAGSAPATAASAVLGWPALRAQRWVHGRIRNFLGATIALAILVVLLTISESTFLTAGNLKNLLVTNAALFIVSTGMTYVMISAGFDLSIGAMMAVSEEILYELLKSGVPALAAIVIVLLIGFVVGTLVNGVLIGVFGVNFFVATLGTMTLFYGLVDVVTNGAGETITSSTLASFGNGTLWGIPMPIVVVVVTIALGGFILRWTPLGRSIYGTGGNREAARLAGVPDRMVIMSVYGVAGLCGALAGVVDAGRLAAATADRRLDDRPRQRRRGAPGWNEPVRRGRRAFGDGGRGAGDRVLGDGVNLLGVSNFWQDVVTGAVLIGAILLDRLQKRGQVLH